MMAGSPVVWTPKPARKYGASGSAAITRPRRFLPRGESTFLAKKAKPPWSRQGESLRSWRKINWRTALWLLRPLRERHFSFAQKSNFTGLRGNGARIYRPAALSNPQALRSNSDVLTQAQRCGGETCAPTRPSQINGLISAGGQR